MNKRYCFFCVGTGGHVFPAKNIILQLLKSGVSEKDIIIVTDKRGVKYFEELNIERIQKDFFSSSRGIFGYVLNIGQFIRTSWQLFNRLKSKNINTILTTGAYIAPYAALMSLLLRSDFFIQEQNLYAGLGNKIASYFPSTVFESFPDTRNINKSNIIFTGPILNIDLADKNPKKINQKFTIGIQGGSQGSEQVNQFVYKFINDFNNSNVNLLHITGPHKSNNQAIDKAFYQQVEFIQDMGKYYKSIDFQISRAGGGILEAAYLNIPQLLVPFKYGTTPNHQTHNAEYLVETGNAITVEDYDQFSKIINNICEHQNSYLKENYKPQNVKVGNDHIFKIITSGSHE